VNEWRRRLLRQLWRERPRLTKKQKRMQHAHVENGVVVGVPGPRSTCVNDACKAYYDDPQGEHARRLESNE
jgi:hypothetical protein